MLTSVAILNQSTSTTVHQCAFAGNPLAIPFARNILKVKSDALNSQHLLLTIRFPLRYRSVFENEFEIECTRHYSMAVFDTSVGFASRAVLSI